MRRAKWSDPPSRPSAAPRSAWAPTRWGWRSQSASGPASETASSPRASSISGARPSRLPELPARRRSTASTSAPAAGPISSSRSGARAGPAGLRAFLALSAEQVAAQLARVRDEVGPDMTIVAATKYVSVEDMATLAEAGVELVGENRAQDLEAKHAAHGDAFRWHFIGHLQSRKAKVVNAICELVHSLDSESAARRLEIPALVQVNLAGETTKSGVPPEALSAFLDLYPDVRGLSTMPP